MVFHGISQPADKSVWRWPVDSKKLLGQQHCSVAAGAEGAGCDNGCARPLSSSASIPAVAGHLHLRNINILEKNWQLSGDVLTEWWKNKSRKIWQW